PSPSRTVARKKSGSEGASPPRATTRKPAPAHRIPTTPERGPQAQRRPAAWIARPAPNPTAAATPGRNTPVSKYSATRAASPTKAVVIAAKTHIATGTEVASALRGEALGSARA